ncbi:methylglyoxal/glyoxal reductase [Cytobacillus horneckiae]|uniref:aldo/keto reductase n=1 Tax=Cytobacillus horneckiae TaxID=549687 RepID=UPI0019D02BFA|nr:aldo/keto reductase [Cytobacillus horneckiae]MBN6886454.1 aldo/keto reductase [Cytobacillus horneckiae]
MNNQKYIQLNNGVDMPVLGYGVFRVEDGSRLANAVKTAIKIGYRSIDTAQIYGNEASVGQGINEAINEGLVKREELFITSKVWNDGLTYQETLDAYNESLSKMGLDYLDLYLIHWPGEDKYQASWQALETIYNEGKVRAIGVSNFQITHLHQLLNDFEVKPVINQIELHPFLTQAALRNFCADNNIRVEAWSPLMAGELLENPQLKKIAERYNKTIAQIILSWDIQHGIITIPKSVTESRIKENSEIFDFELTKEEVKAIDALNKDKRSGPHPDEFNF